MIERHLRVIESGSAVGRGGAERGPADPQGAQDLAALRALAECGELASAVRLALCRALWTGKPVDWTGRWKVEAGVLGHTAQQRWGASTDLAGAYGMFTMRVVAGDPAEPSTPKPAHGLPESSE